MADETTPSDDDLIKEAAKLYNLEADELQKAVKAELLALVAKEIAQKIVDPVDPKAAKTALARLLGVKPELLPEE